MDKDLLSDAKADFKLCVDAESDQREESLDDLSFALLGKQWPDEVETSRKAEGRPCLTINRLPAFIKQVTNDARQNRPSINVHPVGGGAEKEVADIYRDLIRNIENVSKADIAYDTALDFAASMGFGYWIVRDQYTCEDSFDKDLVIERVSNPFSVYGDYSSKEATSVDWNRAFVTDMLTKPDFKKRWKDADASSFDPQGSDEETALWFEESRIRVAEWWTREETIAQLLKLSDGSIMFEDEYLKLKDILDSEMITVSGQRDAKTYQVTQRIISGCDVLETNEWKGKYIPIVPVYGNEINVNGKRYFQSLVKFAKDPQRMFNYWRTASTELVALAPKAPFVGAVGQFATDSARWATANTVSHPNLEYDIVDGRPDAPQRQAFAGVPAGALQEALNASDDMKNVMGLHDASLGAKSNETSGKAIMARQREGDVSTFNFADNRNRAIEHTGTILVDLIPKHYDVARIIRGIKEDGSTYSVPINQPVVPKQNPEQQPAPGQPMQEFEPAPEGMDPEMMKGIVKMFDLTTGKYDVTVSSGPSYTTKREESAEQMMEFIRVFPQAAPLIGDLLAKNLDWPGADEVAARLKAMLPPQAAGQNPQLQAMQGQMQQMDAHAKEAVKHWQDEAQNLTGQLEDLKHQMEAFKADKAVSKYDADTKRIQALTTAAEKGVQLTTAADGSINGAYLVPVAPEPQMPQEPQAPAPTAAPAPDHTPVMAAALQSHAEALHGIGQALGKIGGPKTLVRGPDGRATGIQ